MDVTKDFGLFRRVHVDVVVGGVMCTFRNKGVYTAFLYHLSTNMWYLIVMIKRVVLTERVSGGKSKRVIRRVNYSKIGCLSLSTETEQ